MDYLKKTIKNKFPKVVCQNVADNRLNLTNADISCEMCQLEMKFKMFRHIQEILALANY